MKQEFYKYQAQTTQFASGFEVERAEGSYIYGKDGKAYLDFVAGVSANTLGHSHPKIVQAIKEQTDKYLHVMVYGEYAQEKPVVLCQLLADATPAPLEVTYLVNSGAEAIDGALKLAKRYTGREEIISFKDSYHGNTHGALSVSGNETHKREYRPLLPMINFIGFNEEKDLEQITEKTAGVIVETIQGAAGFIMPENDFFIKLKRRCEDVGALLILDEIQPGFGRTGKLFAFEHFGIVPDILVMGKGMGGGVPVGAFMASAEIMQTLSHSPKLGHITTFGGNPLIAAASLATLSEVLESGVIDEMYRKEQLFRELLVHPKIKKINGMGLMLAVDLGTPEYCLDVAKRCMENGLIVFWQLYKNNYMRITPPLIITEEEIKKGCKIIIDALNEK
ncbi:aspartate aminotransferase family protein [Elizabethkingia anophelis]|uniref:aspartate aminotransferase family protein n=1 Tax=Elizabethkingia anophelis TaxID=1117645 RepID=UPI0012B211A1|nr:aspartate aminotransferase family protein [Elizabethkingia anophelis]QGN23258.1 aminotransferase class III-fold pyridoxal phosphate-dependent enzyme [Elizabethkingia anophelis]QNV09906.1 aspartate aminotransferase family protein [Elizabethkingia anophelis]UTF88046.1 aspartate aminotransferase family protein [Elizabethkingia anophelis]UTF98927.1 aspartate aminotransferase family protein [Elizabethkingia anophelis]UTG02683.1 aspartate aminotransferase family protein [Elizabethkingia anophelis